MLLSHWDWLTIGALFVGLEIVTPGFIFLWIGIAALEIAGLVWLWPDLRWEYQLLSFAAVVLVSLGIWMSWWRRRITATDHPDLNRRGAQYLGRVFVLDSPVRGGRGRMRVDDGAWNVTGPDCPARTQVRVVGWEGNTLQVEPLE